jgi:hypothetical protein
MFFYAITVSGWEQVRRDLKDWLSRRPNRKIVAYVGTDHAITDAEAIRLMVQDGVTVRMMTAYTGVFHPKVVWLRGVRNNYVWIGSNNLTRDGLLNNVEFAAMLKSKGVPSELDRWAREIHKGSVAFGPNLLKMYERERRDYGERRVSLGTFTWSHREKAKVPRLRRNGKGTRRRIASASLRVGDLIVEVMPRETGQDGKQIQLPMTAATSFFGLPDRVGATRTITLTPAWLADPRDLTMTIFGNHTVRLVIKELDYRDRPCVLLFRRRRSRNKRRKAVYEFDIVARAVFPGHYQALLRQCDHPTRSGSRRWGIVGGQNES